MEAHDLTKGSIRRELWSMAWPMMLSIFFYTLYNLVDAYWVSKLSPEAIAAVNISQITLFVMISLGFGITAGSGVIMAMDIGAKNIRGAERILGQSFVLSMIAGVIFTAISLIWRESFLIASGAGGAIFPLALDYYTITAAGSVLFFILGAIMFAFNAQGDTFTLTKLFAISTVINAVLDPIMIFGWFGTPALGIGGAAYATLISQLVFIVIALRSLMKPHRGIRFHFYNLTFVWQSVKKVLNIGIPAALTQMIFPLGTALLIFVTSLAFAEPGAIAYSLGFRTEFFAFLPAVGFGFGGMAMIGQSIGARDLNRARHIFKKALSYGFWGATGMGVLAFIFADPIIALFTTDPVVVDFTRQYMWTVVLSYGFLAIAMIEASVFQAIGRSWPGFWIFLIKFFVVSVPLSYLFTKVFGLPIMYVWIATILGNLISALAGYFWIKRAMDRLNLDEMPVDRNQEAIPAQ